MSDEPGEPDLSQPVDSSSADDLGDISAILSRRSEVDDIADQLKEEFIKQGETLESLLRALREIRDASGGGAAPL